MVGVMVEQATDDTITRIPYTRLMIFLISMKSATQQNTQKRDMYVLYK